MSVSGFGVKVKRLIMGIIAVAAFAAAIFLLPGNLTTFAKDKNISEDSMHYVTLTRITITYVGVLALVGLIMSSFKSNYTAMANIPKRRNYAADLFIVSFLILFMELALMRWIPAHVKLMSYFTNFILLACFLGMGLGCLASSFRVNFFRAEAIFLAVIVAVSLLIFAAVHMNFLSYSTFNISKELVYLDGIRAARLARYNEVSISFIIGIIFVLVVLLFIGPGQLMGQLFNRFNNPVKAYMLNIGASIAGIVCFNLFSFFNLPAWIWFLVIVLIIAWLLNHNKEPLVGLNVCILLMALSLVFFGTLSGTNNITLWSPYYKIFYAYPRITVNEISHQSMDNSRVNHLYDCYHLPYMISHDASGRSFNKVLVIGAGSGNDVSHALLYGAGHVDAVEIDPVIINLGEKEHPNRPYNDPRVRIINDDGRSFLRRTNEQYDLIVYGKLDSLTLMSSFSSVRLENFLFTLEAFGDIKRHLKPEGMFVMYSNWRENWLTVRLYNMLERAFNKKPILLIYPDTKTITDKTRCPIHSTSTIIIDNSGAIQTAFKKYGKYHLPYNRQELNKDFNGFSNLPHDAKLTAFYDVQIIDSGPTYHAVDNWPFLYLRKPALPSQNLWGLVLIGVISLISVGAFMGFGNLPKISLHYFFLGGAFMLLETESIIKLALIHGSTWFVNSVVFASILVMILLANLFILRWPIRSNVPVFLFLFISLAVNYAVPFDVFLGKSWLTESVISSLMLFTPIGFAGIIFANSFRRTKQPALDLGSNLLGIICGGIAEYFSLVYGYNALLLFAAGMYFVSLIALPRDNRMPNRALQCSRPSE